MNGHHPGRSYAAPTGPGLHRMLRRTRRAFHRSALGRGLHRAGEYELMHRAMGFAALGMVTLVPLLIVVAAADPVRGYGFAQWVVDGLGVSGRPAAAVQQLFSTPRKVLSTTSVFSIAALALFGLSFAASVQSGYERVWDLHTGPWHSSWRRVVWLAALTGFLFGGVQTGVLLRHGLLPGVLRGTLTVLGGLCFFWWSEHFLLGGRLRWRVLLPGAVATVLGLLGLRVFSALVFSPLIVANAVSYGAVGTVLIVQSWLIGAGVVIFGGALAGRQLHDDRTRIARRLHLHSAVERARESLLTGRAAAATVHAPGRGTAGRSR